MTGSRWLTSAEACARLGVRPQTLYAYVSRGHLRPRREGGRSRFAVAELDALAARSRRRTRSGRLEVLIDTEITLLDPAGRLHYRGVDVASIVGRWSFERTATWLWSGEDDGEPPPWPDDDGVPAPGERVPDRLRAAAAVLAATAPVEDRAPAAAARVGPRLLARLVASLPLVGDDPGPGAPVAARLWPRLSGARPTAPRLRALDAALVVLADHELAASTMAARVAASVWSPPIDVVVAAMATHAGALHAGSTSQVEAQVRAGVRPPAGYGHAVYVDRDPRADLLLPLAAATTTPARWRRLTDGVVGPEPPNVDLAVAVLAVVGDMVPGAAEAVFALARVPGWLAHAAEEYENPLRYRPTASYVGPRPLDADVRGATPSGGRRS